MVRSVEASLTRLQTDRIDLYWVHMADGVIPIEEIVRGFDDLVRSGKILYAGLSNFPASGKYRAREEGRLQRLGMLVHTEKTARATAILDAVLAVAGEIGTSPTHVAIAWLLHKAPHSTTSLIPILGSRTRAQLDATLSALDMTLAPEQIACLDAASAVPLDVPHAFIQDNAARLAGGKLERVDIPTIPVV